MEGMNRQINRYVTSPKPNIYAFVNHLKRMDSEMSLAVEEYKHNPLLVKVKSKKLQMKEAKFLELKNALKHINILKNEIDRAIPI